MANMNEETLVLHVSTKKLTRARMSAACGELLDGGRRCDGKRSARNCATMADSMMISSFRSASVYLIEGTSPRCIQGWWLAIHHDSQWVSLGSGHDVPG